MAGEGDTERLVVQLEARVRQFEKDMAKASGTATKSYGRMRRDSRRATDAMERDMVTSTSRINRALAATSTRIGGFGKAMVGGFVGGLAAGGVAGIVSSIGRVASAVAEVGDQARIAGVDFESFQELKYVAEQNRIGVDALTDGLKELNLRADEFIVTGAGPAAEAFERLGFTTEELARKLEDPSALFTEIIGKLGDLDRAAQIRIADEIFGGTGGEKFVQLIAQGEQGLADTIDRARELGQVMEEDTLAKARELDSAFKDVANTVGHNLQTAIVNASWALYDFLQQFGAVESRTTASLENDLAEIGARRHELDAMLAEQERQAPTTREIIPGFMGNAQQVIGDGISDLRQEIAELEDRGRSIRNILESRTPIEPPPTRITVNGPGDEDDDSGGGGGGGSRSSAISDIERQRDAVKNLIAGLEFEKSLIGLSAIEQAKLNTLREAGAAATDEQRAQIGALVEEIHREQAQVEFLTGMYDMLGQAGMTAIKGIADAMEDGKITAEEFGAILSNVLAQAGNFFLQTGFNLLGVSLGLPGFASGTANTGGTRGEPRGIVHGQEAVIPLPHGGKIPVQLAGPAPQSQAVAVHVTLGWAQDADGNITPYVENVAQRTVATTLPPAMAATRVQAANDAPAAIARYQAQTAGGDYRE